MSLKYHWSKITWALWRCVSEKYDNVDDDDDVDDDDGDGDDDGPLRQMGMCQSKVFCPRSCLYNFSTGTGTNKQTITAITIRIATTMVTMIISNFSTGTGTNKQTMMAMRMNFDHDFLIVTCVNFWLKNWCSYLYQS